MKQNNSKQQHKHQQAATTTKCMKQNNRWQKHTHSEAAIVPTSNVAHCFRSTVWQSPHNQLLNQCAESSIVCWT
jgi:hypothetical protein